MKIFLSLFTATTLATSVAAFAPSSSRASPPSALAKVVSSSSAIHSSATPEDFISSTSSLPASVLERLNEDKIKRGKPLMETILDPNYNAAIATAMGGPLAAILLNGENSLFIWLGVIFEND